VPVAETPPTDPAAADGTAAATTGGPTGPGWVVQITGHHFHNEEQGNEGEQFVRSTLVKNLLGEGDKVPVAAGEKSGDLVPVADLGIGYPVLVLSSPLRKFQVQTGATGIAPGAGPRFDGGAADPSAGTVDLKRYDFILQFTWQPTTPGSKLPPPPQPAAGEAPVQ
jgi:type IV pilus assembly protein PilM